MVRIRPTCPLKACHTARPPASSAGRCESRAAYARGPAPCSGFGNALAAHLTPRRPRTVVAAIAERITHKVLALSAAAPTPREHAA